MDCEAVQLDVNRGGKLCHLQGKKYEFTVGGLYKTGGGDDERTGIAKPLYRSQQTP